MNRIRKRRNPEEMKKGARLEENESS